jgi:hypothetical protein
MEKIMKNTLRNAAIVAPLLIVAFLLGSRHRASLNDRPGGCRDFASRAFSAGKIVGLQELKSLFGEVSDQACNTEPPERTFPLPGCVRSFEGQNSPISYPFEWDSAKKCFLFYGEPIRNGWQDGPQPILLAY